MSGKTKMRIVDAHQHVFWHGRDDHGLTADMDAHGIDYAWLLSWEIGPFEEDRMYHPVLNPEHLRADGTHPGIPLSDLVRARNARPDRFVLGYCPHPLLGDAPGLLRAAAGVHGARVCGEWKFRMPIDDPRCLELFRTAGELKMPVVLHLDVPYLKDEAGNRTYQENWYGGTVANLSRALEACPGTMFIGHAPGFWREVSGDADDDPAVYPRGEIADGGRLYELFDRFPNLCADLSAGSALGALRRDPGHAEKFLQRYEDRLLFGRDYYERELMTFLEGLSLPAKTMEKICFANAERLVRGPGGDLGRAT